MRNRQGRSIMGKTVKRINISTALITMRNCTRMTCYMLWKLIILQKMVKIMTQALKKPEDITVCSDLVQRSEKSGKTL